MAYKKYIDWQSKQWAEKEAESLKKKEERRKEEQLAGIASSQSHIQTIPMVDKEGQPLENLGIADPSKYYEWARKLEAIKKATSESPGVYAPETYEFAQMINPQILKEMAERMGKPFGTAPRGSFDELTAKFNALKENLQRHYDKYEGIPMEETKGQGWAGLLPHY